MATIYEIHPQTPQIRKIDEIVAALRNGAVMLYPTDTVYAIGCDLKSKTGVDRVRQIKRMSNDKPLTLRHRNWFVAQRHTRKRRRSPDNQPA